MEVVLNKSLKDTWLCVGIDPSIKNTGVVMLNPAGKVVGTVETKERNSCLCKVDYQQRKPESLPGEPEDYMQLIANTCKKYKPLYDIADLVVSSIKHKLTGNNRAVIGYENYSYGSQHKAERIGELGGVLKSALSREGIPICHLAPAQVKLFATGHGQASKAQIKKQASLEDWFFYNKSINTDRGVADLSDDLCDAYFLAKFIWYLYFPENAIKFDNSELKRSRLELCQKLKKKT